MSEAQSQLPDNQSNTLRPRNAEIVYSSDTGHAEKKPLTEEELRIMNRNLDALSREISKPVKPKVSKEILNHMNRMISVDRIAAGYKDARDMNIPEEAKGAVNPN